LSIEKEGRLDEGFDEGLDADLEASEAEEGSW